MFLEAGGCFGLVGLGLVYLVRVFLVGVCGWGWFFGWLGFLIKPFVQKLKYM